MGSGGIAGVGIGQGRQRFGFLPEAHNDFIFSMIGEQWGLIGVLHPLDNVRGPCVGRVPDC
ncbi:MAG: hypothetical protein CM1200mP14_20290 [Gammaproteobacteria bacterium]|nr:MAG: hypothetical protein CM1200mP14_20290 [Gammaproteobacteria bacterium]